MSNNSNNNERRNGSSIFKIISIIFVLFLVFVISSSFLLHEMNTRRQYNLCQQMQDRGIADSNSCFFGDTLNSNRTSGDTNYDGMNEKQFKELLNSVEEK